MKTLETERLILRSWALSDYMDMYAYAKNPKIGNCAGWKPHKAPKDSLEIIKIFIEADTEWAIVYKSTNRIIGGFGLKKNPGRDEDGALMIGYVLSEDYWGKEIMKEAVQRVLQYAFEELEVNAVTVSHFPFNIQSQRVIEKCGFIYQGTLTETFLRYDGALFDEVCYRMTKENYYDLKMKL